LEVSFLKGDKQMDKMAIYHSLPIFAQNAACFLEGERIRMRRFGRYFEKRLREYKSHNNWSYDQICEYRDAKLRELVKHCYHTVPYYTKLFQQYGINDTSIKRMEDLKQIPILDKQTVKNHPNDFISTVVKKNKIKLHKTSGTTGSPLTFHTTWEEEADQWALWWRYRENLGIRRDMLCGQFGGKIVVPQGQKKPPFWRYNSPCHQIYFSPIHINQNTWKDYFECIKCHGIRWIHGYPSIISLLANYMLENHARLNLDFVTTGAENLYPTQAEAIKEAFLGGANRLYQHYGLTEGTANISQNRNHEFIVDEDFSIVEMEPLANDVSLKKIIGTPLKYYVMPLLRYDTGDLASVYLENGKEKIRSLDGRSSDLLLLDNGERISGAFFNLALKGIDGIRECQIVRTKQGVRLDIVKNKTYSPKDEQKLLHEIQQRVGEISITIQEVGQIPRGKNGKMRLVVDES